MKPFKSTFLIIFTAALAGCGGFTKGKPAAERAIAHFHQLYNEGKLEDIWKEADPKFRTASTKQKYDDFMAAVQRKLGKETSTANSAWNVQSFNSQTTVLMNQNTVSNTGRAPNHLDSPWMVQMPCLSVITSSRWI